MRRAAWSGGWSTVVLALVGCGGAPGLPSAGASPEQFAGATFASVGRSLFFDPNLSEPAGEACATCHDPAHGYADNRPGPTSEGAVAGLYGFRNAPSIVYASYIPPLSAAGDDTGYGGGLFLDGRARTLEEQAGGPLLNPVEMANPDRASVVRKVQASAYAADFQAVFGATAFDDPDQAFADIAQAVAAFERTGISNRFTSRYDAYLAGTAQLSDSEARGLAIFQDPKRGNCDSCHPSAVPADGGVALFTDFGYDNLGIPKNPANPFYTLPAQYNPAGAGFVDRGLGGSIINPRQIGKFRAQSLRNVALTAPYGHNGYFPDLRSIVQFYSNRDVADAGWPAPEVPTGVNTTDLGNLGLSDQDIDDLVAFLQTLTDAPSGAMPENAGVAAR